MRQIRQGVWETNSSSVHAIAIARNDESFLNSLPDKLFFGAGEFGWEFNRYSDLEDKAAYLYTAIVSNSMVDELVPKIKEILGKWGINCEFARTEKKEGWNNATYDDFSDLEGYIDHGYELKEFIKNICSNEVLLMTFLFSDESFVATGNDNDDMDLMDSKTDAKEILYVYDKGN